jgi:hypothetical protein
MTPQAATLDPAELSAAVAELCVRIPVAAGTAELARALSALAPRFQFREVLCRGGWYRLGGVVDAAGDPVADDLERWAEEQLAAHEDIGALFDAYEGSGLCATRIAGKTHYLVAAAGNSAAAFVQLEIEELQESAGHPLFQGELPASIEELVDPRRCGNDAGKPLGAPFYALRRFTDMAQFVRRMADQKPEPQPVHRFLKAWDESSAAAATRFSNHWLLAVREHLNRYRQPVLQATPIAALNGPTPIFDIGFGAQGLALQRALQSFDRQLGYPMAWFFHMITTKCVPHAVANIVIDDVQAGFNYLPDRDVAIVKEWLFRPYGF